MQIREFVWLSDIVDKLIIKHNVTTTEVEDVFYNRPLTRFQEKGYVEGEDVYTAYGQTFAGRYLTVIYIAKSSSRGLIISARDMTKAERRHYGRKKKN